MNLRCKCLARRCVSHCGRCWSALPRSHICLTDVKPSIQWSVQAGGQRPSPSLQFKTTLKHHLRHRALQELADSFCVIVLQFPLWYDSPASSPNSPQSPQVLLTRGHPNTFPEQRSPSQSALPQENWSATLMIHDSAEKLKHNVWAAELHLIIKGSCQFTSEFSNSQRKRWTHENWTKFPGIILHACLQYLEDLEAGKTRRLTSCFPGGPRRGCCL